MDDREIYVAKSTQIFILAIIFLNLQNSFNIMYKLFKFGVVTPDIITEGTVSQMIFDLGPSCYFM